MTAFQLAGKEQLAWGRYGIVRPASKLRKAITCRSLRLKTLSSRSLKLLFVGTLMSCRNSRWFSMYLSIRIKSPANKSQALKYEKDKKFTRSKNGTAKQTGGKKPLAISLTLAELAIGLGRCERKSSNPRLDEEREVKSTRMVP
jgi:hypothetical protein